MVDVGVGRREAPQLGVLAEAGAHVLVDELLQIDARPAEGTDHEIRAYAASRDVAARVGDPLVARLVGRAPLDLAAGGGEDLVGERGGRRLRGGRGGRFRFARPSPAAGEKRQEEDDRQELHHPASGGGNPFRHSPAFFSLAAPATSFFRP